MCQLEHGWTALPPYAGPKRSRGDVMLVSTMNDLPGYAVTEVLGEVFGLTVRARNIGSQLGAQFKSLVGGELRGMTTALIESRNQVMERMVDEARAKGADAVLAMRFDTSEMGPNSVSYTHLTLPTI